MHGLSFLLYRQMSPQCTFNTSGLWQRQPRLLVLFRLVLQDLSHSQPSDWLSLTEKHSILQFLIQKFLNRAQVYFMLPTPESIPVMAENYCVSDPRGRKSRVRNSWDCPFNQSFFWRLQNINNFPVKSLMFLFSIQSSARQEGVWPSLNDLAETKLAGCWYCDSCSKSIRSVTIRAKSQGYNLKWWRFFHNQGLWDCLTYWLIS